MNLLENRGLNEDTFMLIWESFPKKVEIWSKIHFATTSLVVQSCTIQSDQNICWLMPPFPQTLDIFQMSSYWELLHTRVDDVMASQTVYFYPRWCVPKSTTHPDISYMILTNQSNPLKEKQATW